MGHEILIALHHLRDIKTCGGILFSVSFNPSGYVIVYESEIVQLMRQLIGIQYA